MTERDRRQKLLAGGAVIFFLIAAAVRGEDLSATQEQLQLLKQQNDALQQQLQKQQELIDSLTRKVSEIQNANSNRDLAITDLKAEVKDQAEQTPAPSPIFGKVHISGEGGIAFFDSQSKGPYSAGQFRIDEAKLFVESPVWGDVYFYSEIDLASREETSLNLNVGELYLDWVNVSDLWGQEKQVNFRAGHFYIPFGEEYQNRFAIDNPLISHSVSDLWGADDGVELYGRLDRFQYAVAVQSGGGMTSQDFTGDKSVAGRIGYDPANWLHLSASGMRTGSLSSSSDMISALWFANGWFRSIGGPGTTRFHANLAELDADFRFPWLRLNTAGGYAQYDDNDPAADNYRNIYYYYVEGVHDFTRKFYAATRFSQVFAPGGYPIVAGGTMGADLFGPVRTEEYWRLSLGMGYRFSSRLVVKVEYTFNQGKVVGGAARTDENMFALEGAFRF
jgi:hypothetical protein